MEQTNPQGWEGCTGRSPWNHHQKLSLLEEGKAGYLFIYLFARLYFHSSFIFLFIMENFGHTQK